MTQSDSERNKRHSSDRKLSQDFISEVYLMIGDIPGPLRAKVHVSVKFLPLIGIFPSEPEPFSGSCPRGRDHESRVAFALGASRNCEKKIQTPRKNSSSIPGSWMVSGHCGMILGQRGVVWVTLSDQEDSCDLFESCAVDSEPKRD